MGIAKTRVALKAEIDAIITDGGELTASEHRDILDNLLTSMVNIDDDIVPASHSALRAYNAGDIITYENRPLRCYIDIIAKTFDYRDWDELDRMALANKGTDDTATANIDLAASGDSPSKNHRFITAGGATQTVTTITNGVLGRYYLFTPVTGKTITFTHTGIGGAVTDQMVNKGGANLVLVGRAGEKSDWVRYYLDNVDGIFMEIDSAIYP